MLQIRTKYTFPVFLSLVVLLLSCASNRMIETSLYFGLSKPGGGSVTEKEWTEFREKHLSTTFKKGSTTYTAIGNWFDPESQKLITEPTYVVVYFYRNSKEISRRIDSLRARYKSMYQQQSVLRVDKKVQASF